MRVWAQAIEIRLILDVTKQLSGLEPLRCAQIVLNATSFQPIQAYSSQSSDFSETLAGVGLNEAE